MLEQVTICCAALFPPVLFIFQYNVKEKKNPLKDSMRILEAIAKPASQHRDARVDMGKE